VILFFAEGYLKVSYRKKTKRRNQPVYYRKGRTDLSTSGQN
jgi:hypothetical protein